ncbi:MAG: hypothetical protein NXH75_17785, partial [Halobacteriovoraceae bacterium]|nr:hypothetical protein [Halobacteriovoraceae bacterium]
IPSNKTAFINRLNTLRTNVVPGNDWSFPGNREIRSALIDDLNRLRVHSLDRQGPILNRIRLGLTALQQQQPELMRQKLSTGSSRTHLTHPSLLEMDRLTDREDVPNYCSHYPILQRSEIEDHYSGAQNGEQFTCHQVSQHSVGLDLKDIGNILGNMENSRYSQFDDTLKEDLLQVSTAGVLRESAAYSGLYPNTNPDLTKLKSCARNKPKLKSLINQHENTLPERVNAHNELYQNEGQDRKETFLKENIKQALIVGNLYHLQRRGGAENRRIEAGARARAIAICRAEQEERSGFYYIPSTVRSRAVYLNRLCRRRTSRGDFNTQMECRTAYTRLSGQASFKSDYETCMSNQGTPNTFNLEALVPLMAGKIDSFPLLFDRKDNLNLLPFTESKSEFVPSDFSKKIKDLDGADEISEAIKTALLANPHDPEGAINSVMESSPWKESIDTLVNNAKNSAEVNNVFKDEIKEYQKEIIESAEKTCDNNAENLHHFPKLIEEVIARRLNEPNLSTEDKKTILAEAQAAQCHLLQREPPDETGGLPTALTVIGVAGAIA